MTPVLALLIAALQTAAPPVLPPPTAPVEAQEEALEAIGEALEARQARSRLTVPVRVDGQGPYRFIVDSGADRTVVGAALARRLSLPAGRTVTVHGMAGAQPVQTVKVATLEVGSRTISGIAAPALAEQYLGADGLLGVDALADQRVTMDFVRSEMRVAATAKPEPAAADEIVVTARRRFGQLILADASVDTDRIFAIVDTGAQATIGNSALRARIFGKRKRAPAVVPVTLVAVTGQTIVADLAIVPRLKIGGLLLGNVPVAFTDSPPFALFGLTRSPAMLLGTDVLQAFRRISLDFRNKKVRFTLRR